MQEMIARHYHVNNYNVGMLHAVQLSSNRAAAPFTAVTPVSLVSSACCRCAAVEEDEEDVEERRRRRRRRIYILSCTDVPGLTENPGHKHRSSA